MRHFVVSNGIYLSYKHFLRGVWGPASRTPRSGNQCMAWIHGHHAVLHGQTAHQVRTSSVYFQRLRYLTTDTLYVRVSHVSLVLCVGMTRWACCLRWWSGRTLWRTGSCWFATATPPSERPCTSPRSDSLFSDTYPLRKTSDPLLPSLCLMDLLILNLIARSLKWSVLNLCY